MGHSTGSAVRTWQSAPMPRPLGQFVQLPNETRSIHVQNFCQSLRSRRFGYITASVVPAKGAHPYTVKRLGTDLTNIMGYKRVILKSDQERAIKKLKSQVRLEYSLEVPDEESCTYDSQSNAEAEITVQVVEGQVRTLKCHLEARLGQEINTDSNLLPWLVRHAGAQLSRFQKGKDGFTGYRRLRGRDFSRKITEFGECVWYLRMKTKGKNKGAQGSKYRWAEGSGVECVRSKANTSLAHRMELSRPGQSAPGGLRLTDGIGMSSR